MESSAEPKAPKDDGDVEKQVAPKARSAPQAPAGAERPQSDWEDEKLETEEKSDKKPSPPSPEMQEFQETGQWGTVSRKECYLVTAVVVIVLIVAAIVVIVLVVTADSDGDDAADTGADIISSIPTMAPVTSAPTMSPTVRTVFQQTVLNEILSKMSENGVTTINTIAAALPTTIGEYQNKWNGLDDPDTAFTPQERAMGWLLWEEGQKLGELYLPGATTVATVGAPIGRLLDRYALVALFLQFNGQLWKTSTDWLNPTVDHCDWYGIVCDIRTHRVTLLQLNSNNLTGSGPMPVEFALLEAVTGTNLRNNDLQHSLPDGSIFGTLQQLTALHLQLNRLQGTIPRGMLESGSLQTMMLQENDFEGVFPFEYCPPNRISPAPLSNFIIDCQSLGGTVSCPTDCCTAYNCG